ncbi:LGFP repeat-containing protein [Tsukamurella soli]
MRIARTIATFAAFAAAAAIAAAPAYADPAPAAPTAPVAPAAVAAPVAAAVPAAVTTPAAGAPVAGAVPAATPAVNAAQTALTSGDTSALLAQLAQIPGMQQIATSGQLPTTDIPTLLRMLASAEGGQTQSVATVPATVPMSNVPVKFPVVGAIGDTFDNDGGVGRYGQPLAVAKTVAGGWKEQDFTNGAIFWNPKVNGGKAAGVDGAIAAAWRKAGGAKGKLGYPLMSEAQIAGPTAGTIQGAYNDFEHGSIYWSPTYGAKVLTGKLRDQFIEQGGANALGYPTTDPYKVPGGGMAQTFTKGTVTVKS